MEGSIVIPCFNEELVIDELIRRLVPCCESTFSDSFEILLVNDGSSDSTWRKICAAADKDNRVKGVNLSRNYGHQIALTAGLECSTGEWVFVIDADLQDPPELFPLMLSLAKEENAAVVYGKRKQRSGETRFKRVSAHLFYRLLNILSDIDMPTDVGDFRLLRRDVVNALNAMKEPFRYIRGMVAWVGFRQLPFEYERDERYAGDTKYPLTKMVSFALDAISSFSARPLRLCLYLSLLVLVPASMLVAYVFWSWITIDLVPGWASLISVVLVLGSFQLLAIGVVGEYVGRVFMTVKGRPLYIISEITDREAGV